MAHWTYPQGQQRVLLVGVHALLRRYVDLSFQRSAQRGGERKAHRGQSSDVGEDERLAPGGARRDGLCALGGGDATHTPHSTQSWPGLLEIHTARHPRVR